MCGIAGFWSGRGKVLPESELGLLADSIAHRGPDDQGYWYGGTVGLANRRLSIIDVEGGHQPFASDDGRIVVVQNGEIYNYIELAEELAKSGVVCRTNSDTEVILRLYEKHGIEMLEKLNGMFAIAVLDRRNSSLYLARDRLGVKPLFWHDNGGVIRFASEIKSITRCGIRRDVNKQALHQFLTLNYVPPPNTMFEGIRHVQPGHYLVLSKNKPVEHKWWSMSVADCRDGYDVKWEEEFRELLDSATRLRMRSDVPFGAFLSGGVDSSAVVATMAQQSASPVRSFCIGFEDKRFDESQFAESLALRVGASHVTEIAKTNMLRLWPRVTYFNDQPHGDVSFMPTYVVSELAAREVKLVLTGDGGDELFAGYDKYLNFFEPNSAAKSDRSAFEECYFDSLLLFSPEQMGALYGPELRGQLDWTIRDQIQPLIDEQSTSDGVNLALYIDLKWLLPGNNLVKPDRMAMANSLEARSPFLDYRFAEWAFSLPGGAKLRNGTTKHVMKAAVSDLIGADLAYRKKQMFTVPIGEWLKDRAHDLADAILFDDVTVQRDFFRVAEVRRMFDAHRSGRENYTRELRALVALELWMRIFIDQKFDSAPDWDDIGIPFDRLQ